MSKSDGVFIFIGTYASEVDARADYDVVKDLHAAGAVGTYDAAVVSKDDMGKVHVNKDETTTRHGAWGGAAAGALVGILFPPSIIGSALVGAAIGGVSGHLWKGMSRADIKEFGDAIDAGEAALVIVGAEHRAGGTREGGPQGAQARVEGARGRQGPDRRGRAIRRQRDLLGRPRQSVTLRRGRQRDHDRPARSLRHLRGRAGAGDPRFGAQDGRAAPGGHSRAWRRRCSRSSTACSSIARGRGRRAIRSGRCTRRSRWSASRWCGCCLMVVAFTFIFWGTGSLTWPAVLRDQRLVADDARVRRAGHDGRIWLAFIEATIGLGPRRPPHQLSADDLRRLQRPGEGHHPAPPDRRRAPGGRRPSSRTSSASGPWTARSSGATSPIGSSTSSRRTRRSRSSRTSPRRTGTIRGWRPSARCSTPPRS